MSQISYHVDITMCIDATGSMQPVIDMVKNNALNFDERLKSALADKEKNVDKLRMRLIFFRDIYHDGLEESLMGTDFVELPDEKETFRDWLEGVQATGGGDAPETSLEALSVAMNSEWTREGDKRRHLIVMFTDDAAHPLEKSEAFSGEYPEGMPKNFSEFVEMWEGQTMDDTAKRMLIFAPNKDPWPTIAETCDEVFMIESQAGKGLVDKHWDEILKGIVNSV